MWVWFFFFLKWKFSAEAEGLRRVLVWPGISQSPRAPVVFSSALDDFSEKQGNEANWRTLPKDLTKQGETLVWKDCENSELYIIAAGKEKPDV